MRLAVIADIHGNLLALEAVLADIERRGADATVNPGDCVSGPLWPRETMDLLDKLALPTVRGNHDRWIAETPRERMFPSDVFATDRLTREQCRALGALPHRLDVGEGIVAFHGTPRNDNEYLLDAIVDGRLAMAQPAQIAERLGEMPARVLLCGHSHQARSVRGAGDMLIVNPGSVGCPGYVDPTPPAHVSEAGSPHARYALLTAQSDGRWSVDLIALPYDWTSASERAAANGRTEWAQALATGFVG